VEKSAPACRDNISCGAKDAAQISAIKQRLAAPEKYFSHARVVVIPPRFVGPSPISFFKKFSTSLHEHTKSETRRKWGGGAREHSQKGNLVGDGHSRKWAGNENGHFLNHKRALDEHLFVRVWCGKKGNLIGYIIYHSFTPQKLGDMTLDDVKAEGGGNMSVKQFRLENFENESDDTWFWVVRFTFIPLLQVMF
jgi:hypothetical protein